MEWNVMKKENNNNTILEWNVMKKELGGLLACRRIKKRLQLQMHQLDRLPHLLEFLNN